MEPIKKKSGEVIMCQFGDYIKQKEAFFAKHPDATILEEIKNLFVGEIDMPDPQLIGRTKKGQTVMILWGVVYEEKIIVSQEAN